MRRHGNLFEKVTKMENIFNAYRLARKGKSWQDTIKRFEENLGENLIRIRKSLINKTFTTSNYTEMTIYEPKTRKIHKLPFSPDRIVQHALMNIIEPIWDRLFIFDSYSCRKNKGIHAGSKRTMEFIRKVGKSGYCLKMDISKFYPSMKHDILFEIIQKKIKCEDTLNLIENIIYSMPNGINIPIGNYTSQWFGNLYMNEIDNFIKHELKIKYYIRYCDDSIILHQNKKYLHEIKDKIENFINTFLDLRFSKKDIFKISQGIDFLGYRHFPNYVLIRKSTAKRIKKRIKKLPLMLKRGDITKDQYRSSVASTLGWLKWSNGYNFRQNLSIDKLWRDITHG